MSNFIYSIDIYADTFVQKRPMLVVILLFDAMALLLLSVSLYVCEYAFFCMCVVYVYITDAIISKF